MGRAILIVLTNASQIPPHHSSIATQKVGFDVKELALAYFYFHKTLGLEVNFASPAGGQCYIDPASLKASEHEEEVQAFLADNCAMQWVKCTDALGNFDLGRFQAIVFVGGPGAMFDFPASKSLGKVTKYIWKRDGVVAAIGHGVAALLAMTGTCDGDGDSDSDGGDDDGGDEDSGDESSGEKADGDSTSSDDSDDCGEETKKRSRSSWLHGRKVTANTVEEDRDLQLEKTLPFSIEKKLREAGAQFSKTSKFENHVVIDGRLITAQNRNSTREWLRAISSKVRK